MEKGEAVRIFSVDNRKSDLTPTDCRNAINEFEKEFADLSSSEREKATNGYWFYCKKAYSETPPTLTEIAEKIKVFGATKQLDFGYRNSITELFKKSIQTLEHVNKTEIVFPNKLSDLNDISGLATTSEDIANFLLEQYSLIANEDLRMTLIRATIDILGSRSIAFGLVNGLKSENSIELSQSNEKIAEIITLVLNSSREEPRFDNGTRIGTEKTMTRRTIPAFSEQDKSYDYTNVIRPEDKDYLISVKN